MYIHFCYVFAINWCLGVPSSVVAPGMAARFAVRFAPMSLNDQTDGIRIRTELGDQTAINRQSIGDQYNRP